MCEIPAIPAHCHFPAAAGWPDTLSGTWSRAARSAQSLIAARHEFAGTASARDWYFPAADTRRYPAACTRLVSSTVLPPDAPAGIAIRHGCRAPRTPFGS